MNIFFVDFFEFLEFQKIQKKMKTQKSESEPPNTNLCIQKKELARLNYIFEKKNTTTTTTTTTTKTNVWLSFGNPFFFVFFYFFWIVQKKGEYMYTPTVRSWTPNTNLCIQKNLDTKLYIWKKESNA